MSRTDETRFDTGFIGPESDHVDSLGALDPWRLGEVRIDGIEPPLPTFQAGEGVSLSCVFLPTDGATDHIERWKAVRRYHRWASDVTTYQAQGRALYREQHPGVDGSQLAQLAPLERSHTGFDSAPRPSVYEPMWVVVTGVSDGSQHPESAAVLDVSATTIARVAEYPTRAGVRAAFERNGFGV